MAGRYALIIANDTFADQGLRGLRAPSHDAEELAGVLADPAIGEFTVARATNEREWELRRRIAAFFAEKRRDDLLLMHVSSHGLKDESGQLYSPRRTHA